MRDTRHVQTVKRSHDGCRAWAEGITYLGLGAGNCEGLVGNMYCGLFNSMSWPEHILL